MYIWSKLILFWKTWSEGVGRSRIPSKDPQRPGLGNPSTCPFVSLVEHDEQGVDSSRIASKDPQSPGLGNPSTCPLVSVRREGVGRCRTPSTTCPFLSVRREGVGRCRIPSKDPQSPGLGNPFRVCLVPWISMDAWCLVGSTSWTWISITVNILGRCWISWS